jgi:hypothetical protein
MMVVKAGVTRMAPIPKWAEGVENEVRAVAASGVRCLPQVTFLQVEKAIGKGVSVSYLGVLTIG